MPHADGAQPFKFCPKCGAGLASRVLKDGEPERLVCSACGFVDRGESVAQAAVRETLEEVGLRVSVTGILDVYSYPGEDVAVIVYAADVIGGKLTIGDEAEDVIAFAPEELPWDDLAFPSTVAALKDYVRRFFPRVRIPR